MERFDVIVVGGGPAGSAAARRLVTAGLRAVVLDREPFPRVKLCAGWLSEPIWDELELAPAAYPLGLWTWERCHVHYQGRQTSITARGYFIRRYELDDFLLRRSGAQVIRHSVKSLARVGDEWIIDDRFAAPHIVGAGGTHCPVARVLGVARTERPVGVQELEFPAEPAAVAAHRLGGDGEPELLLHDDFGGYSWNVPKTDWLNVGCGTMEARQVRAAWSHARGHFAASGHLPPGAAEQLEHAKGHSYYLFDPGHLASCQRDGAFLVGDSLGLAQPMTAEGILPAVISGRLAGEAIVAGDPASYAARLAQHPVIADYDLYYRFRMAGSRLKDRAARAPKRWSIPTPAMVSQVGNAAVARGFGWMFAGKPVPARRMLQRLMGSSLMMNLFSPADALKNLRRTLLNDAASETYARELLRRADITVGGDAPHDIAVHDSRFYTRVLRDGSLGFGESYVEGWWDSPALDQTMTRILRARLDSAVRENLSMTAHVIRAKVLNLQSVVRAFEVGEKHYDVGNDLYEAMLDRRMMYTCGYWKDANDLDAAQEAKLDLICRKLDLKPGMTVLELGCGWGGFARFAAENYGAIVTGYTVSKEQVVLARARCAGLPVTIHLADYRDAAGTYDAVVSIGLMEHVGYKNYGTYMELVERCLVPGGIAFIHTIGGNKSETAVEPWFHKYIFANALLPSIAQLGAAMEERFSLEDLHNIGPHYDPTLMAWHANFEAAWPRFAAQYGEKFHRMWNYYLLSSAAGFRARYCQLYQIVMTRIGTPAPECRKV